MKYQLAEPFRIKVVEPIRKSTRAERQKWLREAQYNVFRLRAEHTYIDCLTDSGTTAMSQNQWAAIMTGDESYAGCRSYYSLVDSVHEIFGMEHVQPTHQGRAADYIMAQIYTRPGTYAIGNMHFDTFRGNAEMLGAHPIDCVIDEGISSNSAHHPFKGNLDLAKIESLIAEKGVSNICVIIITVTCNNNGGQPVSMANIRGVSEIARRNGIPVVIDAARFAENAYFIKQREAGYSHKSIIEIANEMFSCCETAVMSCKKDGLVNIGGLFVTRNAEIFLKANQLGIVHEGFTTYGGLAGRDLEALAVGLREGCDEAYLEYRVNQVAYLGQQLTERNVPHIEPVGGHGVYVDGRRFFPHIPQALFPSQRLVCALYETAGVRAVELGACAFGSKDKQTGAPIWPKLETMRIAIPRRVYTNRHLDVIAQALGDIHADRSNYSGMRLVHEGPITALRHFTAGFELL